MKTPIKIIFIIALLFLSIFNAKSQSFNMGIGLQFYKYSGSALSSFDPGNFQSPYTTSTDFDDGVTTVGIFSNYYQPIHKFDENMSLGINPGIGLFGYYDKDPDIVEFGTGNLVQSGSSSEFWAMHIPVYIAFVYGDGATYKTKLDNGFATGLGFSYHTFKAGIPAGDKGTEITPTAYIEGNLKGTKIRINYSFKKYESHYDSYTGDIPKIKYSNWGFSVTISFS